MPLSAWSTRSAPASSDRRNAPGEPSVSLDELHARAGSVVADDALDAARAGRADRGQHPADQSGGFLVAEGGRHDRQAALDQEPPPQDDRRAPVPVGEEVRG
jgi:hypothetical protein